MPGKQSRYVLKGIRRQVEGVETRDPSFWRGVESRFRDLDALLRGYGDIQLGTLCAEAAAYCETKADKGAPPCPDGLRPVEETLACLRRGLDDGEEKDAGAPLRRAVSELRDPETGAHPPGTASLSTSKANDHYLSLFVRDTWTQLAHAETELTGLRSQETGAMEPLICMERMFTLFGALAAVASFLRLPSIGPLSREASIVMDKARRGAIVLPPSWPEVMLETIHVLRLQVDGVARTLATGIPNNDGARCDTPIRRLRELAGGDANADALDDPARDDHNAFSAP